MDVYISYRRNNYPITRLIYEHLKKAGCSAFLDMERILSGSLQGQITDAIDACENFLLILDAHTLDRCVYEDDFVRKEIEYAIKQKKNIIPVASPDFRFPDNLPTSLQSLKKVNMVLYSIDYFDASMEKIVNMIRSDNNQSMSKPIQTKTDASNWSITAMPPELNNDQEFIFISYAHRDDKEVIPVIRELQMRGFRVWYDEGIDPGTEWDEYIAERIESCGMMLAMISKAYLDSDNCKDELNFARDLNKKRILIYLEDVQLPRGMAMRLNRLQAIHKYTYPSMDRFLSKLLSVSNIYDFCDA